MSRPTANIDPSTRPYPCPYPGCEWRFSRLEHQTRHLRTHSGERPFQCQYANCPSKFARNDELKRHIRLVHEWDKNDSPGLADSDEVVFNGVHQSHSHSRTPSIQRLSSGAPRPQVPARPQTSMSHHRPNIINYSGPGSPPPASRSSSSSSRGILPLHPISVSMAQQPLAPLHPPLPMHYRAPPEMRSQTPIILPPLRQSDGYTTDNGGVGGGGSGGGRRGEIRLPGFSESFSQIGRPTHDQSSYTRRISEMQSEGYRSFKKPKPGRVTRLTGHSSCVNALTWSGNGRWLATAGDDANIALWDFYPTEPILSTPDIFRGSSLANILCLAFTSSSHFILSGSVDGRIFQYDLSRMSSSSSSSSLTESPRSRSDYNVQIDACIRGIAPNPSQDVIFLTASEDGFVTAYDSRVPSFSASSTRGVGSISLNSEATGVQFHPSMESLFITTDGRGRCKLWDIRTAFSSDQQKSKCLLKYVTKLSKPGRLNLSNPEASSVVFDPSGTKLAVTFQHFLPTFYNLWDEWPIAICSASPPPVQTELTTRILETTVRESSPNSQQQQPPPSASSSSERSYVNACSIKHGSFGLSGSQREESSLYYGAGSDDFRGYVWRIPDGLSEYRREIDYTNWVAEPNGNPNMLAFAKSVTGQRVVPQLLDKPQFLIYVLFHPFEPYIATAGIERHVLIHSSFRTTPICENMNETDKTVRQLPTTTTDNSYPPRRQSRSDSSSPAPSSPPQQILALDRPLVAAAAAEEEEVSNYDAEFSDTSDEVATIRYFDGLLISEGTPDVFDLRSWSDDDDDDADSTDGLEGGYETID